MAGSGRTARRTTVLLRWVARIVGTLLLVVFLGRAVSEARLVLETRDYGDRIFSFGVLAALLGLVLGWSVERMGGALIVGGCLLTVGAAVVTGNAHSGWPPDAPGVAAQLFPIFVVGIIYLYVGRTRYIPI
jgi:hypothetical protein